MKHVPKLLKRNFLKRKYPWVLIIVFSVLVSIIILLIFFKASNNAVNIFVPNDIKVATLDISLKCTTNNLFFTDSSPIKCFIAAKTLTPDQWSYVGMNLQVFKTENQTLPIALCIVDIWNVTNSSFTEFIPCKFINAYSSVEDWVPQSVGTYRIGVYTILVNPNNPKQFQIYQTYTPLVDRTMFNRDLTVISSGEAFSRQATILSLLVAVIAVITNIPLVIFEFRKFLKEK